MENVSGARSWLRAVLVLLLVTATQSAAFAEDAGRYLAFEYGGGRHPDLKSAEDRMRHLDTIYGEFLELVDGYPQWDDTYTRWAYVYSARRRDPDFGTPTWYDVGSVCGFANCLSEGEAVQRWIDETDGLCIRDMQAAGAWEGPTLTSGTGMPTVQWNFDKRYEYEYTFKQSDGSCGTQWTSHFTIAHQRTPVSCPNGFRFVYTGSDWDCEPKNVSRKTITAKPIFGNCDTCAGNPVNLVSGAKLQSETLYSSSWLTYRMHYNSKSNFGGVFGVHWLDNFSSGVMRFWGPHVEGIQRPDGSFLKVTLLGGRYYVGTNSELELLRDPGGWRIRKANGETEVFNAQGVLMRIERPGRTDLFIDRNGRNQAVAIRDSAGRTLTLQRDAQGRVEKVIDSEGGETALEYGAFGKLLEIVYPDGSVKQFLYEDARFPWAITGIVDENGDRYASYAYDYWARTVSSEHAGGAERVDISYQANGDVSVNEASGNITTYAFHESTMGYVPVASDEPCAGNCGFNYASASYDRYGRLARSVDFNGVATQYVRDSKALVRKRTEAAGTPQERIFLTNWHPDFRLPTYVGEPGRTTTYTYDDNGNRLSRNVIDPATGETRTTTWTYNAFGLVETVDGPRTDVSDVTSYAYDAQGNLASVTNALGHVTRYTRHDAHGNPLEIIDPNGLVTELEYDLRQRLVRRTVAAGTASAATTRFDYDAVGQLTRTTLPNGAWIAYEYDAAHRLVAITDTAGNRIDYTLDAMGNRVEERVSGPGGATFRETFREYNELNRLVTESGPEGSRIDYAYDAEGNRTEITDANNQATTQRYDALDRLFETVDALGGVTSYEYDPRDNLTKVVDPRGVTTDYTYNGFNELLETASPDAGTTTYTYDAAGNRITQTDARGITVDYQYDALNRLTLIDYPGTDKDIRYVYDEGANGIGRLSRIEDETGRTEYTYGPRGNLLNKLSVVNSDTGEQYLPVGYEHDAADNLASMSYPSGNLVQYRRDAAGRVTDLVLTKTDGTQVTLASQIEYAPFGPARSLTLGNGLTETRSFDREGRITRLRSGSVLDYGYSWDATGNITGIGDNLDSTRSQAFGYDALYRLTSAQGVYGDLGYDYDAVGNRTRETDNGADTVYGYEQASNRLASVAGPDGSASYQYDAAGNTLNDGEHNYAYDARNRFTEADGPDGEQYRYAHNALGQRVMKPRFQTAAPGDASGDGVIDENDLHVLRDILRGRAPESPGADCNQDGTVDNRDVSCIANQIGDTKNNGKGKPNSNAERSDSLSPRGERGGVRGSMSPTSTSLATSDGPGDIVGQTLFVYDESGHLLGEYDELGNAIREYFWLGDRPVAMLDDNGNAYYIHADHLNTPKVVTDANQQVAWKGDYSPFGEVEEVIETVEMNLRFPGQYEDRETGLNYNWNRYYDVATGRFTSADRIGLSGGKNLYLYALANPIMYVDMNGNEPQCSYWSGHCREKAIPAAMTCLRAIAAKYAPLAVNDKYKHCMVAGEIYKQCGPVSANVASIGKEVQDVFTPGDADWADIEADYAGIDCAANPECNQSLEECCIAKGYEK